MGEGRKRKLSVAVEWAVADEAALVLDTFGGKLHVKFDHATSVTMLGHRLLLCTARRTRRDSRQRHP